MKIIVTGSDGFLGKQLVNQLKQNNYIIFEYDLLKGYDILDREQLEESISTFLPDSVIHLAACSDLNIFRNNPDISYKVNVIGTRNILDMCEKYNSRLLFASTCCIYGNNNCHPSDESSPTAPTEAYAQSKKKSEEDILKIGLPHCCMRLATFYGPNMRNALSPAVFINKSYNDEIIEIHGTGEQSRTITYVDDIVSGIVSIVKSTPKYTIINITTEEVTTVLEMIDIVKNLTQKQTKCIHIKDRDGQIYKEHILNGRLKSFGWNPQFSFKEGMRNSYYNFLNNK
jgi:nucleoside-diphosphate-sugar epimerase